MEIINPSGWAKPLGYNNAVKVRPGLIVFIAGQVGWDSSSKIVSDDLVAQFDQALHNVVTVACAAGAKASDITRMTLYVTDKAEYLSQRKEIGISYKKYFGYHFPSMTLVEVKSLLEEGAKIEIECTAVIESE